MVRSKRGAAKAAPGQRGAAKAAPGQRGAAKAAPGQRGAAKAAPGQRGAAKAAPGQRGAAKAEPAAPRTDQEAAELAREICLRQLAVRPRTRAELAQALRKNGIPDHVAEQVLDRYDEVGIVDDGAFARAWVSSRHHSRGLARRALAGELRRKGVATEDVGTALEQVDESTEEATARALVARRLRSEVRAAGRDDAAVLRRLVGMLARKGYPPGLAIRVVRDAMAADATTTEFAGELDVDALVAAMEPATDLHAE